MMIKRVQAGGSAGLPRRASASPSTAGLALPDGPKAAALDFYAFASLVYGRQGIGKTTFAASFPDCVLFSCERVSRAVEACDFNADGGGVKDWDIFRAGVKLLEESERFRTIAIDTIEAAYQHCLRWVCKREGVAHPHDRNDYGKTWDMVRDEFAGQLDRIWSSGRGIVFTAHAKEATITAHSGDEFVRIQPNVAGQALKYLQAKTDNIFYAEYLRLAATGETVRVLITEGDDLVEAKHAGTIKKYLPMPKEGGAALVALAFQGGNVGYDAAELRVGKQTREGAAKMINAERVEKAGAVGAPTKKVFKRA